MSTYDEADQAHGPRRAAPLRALTGGARSLPHDIETEAHLLACVFIDATETLARCDLMQLTPAAFYDARHVVIFEVARDMWRKNFPVDIATLAAELRNRLLIDQAGGIAYLGEISGRVATTAQTGFFLEKVFELGLLRAFLRDAAGAIEDGHSYTGGLDELLGRHASKLQRLADFAARRNRQTQREIALDADAYAVAAMNGTLDKSRAMPFGGLPHTTAAFTAFDVREEDWLILIGAIRSVGKSTFTRQHVAHNLLAGRRFVVFLLETSKARWLNGIAGMFAGVSIRPDDLLELRALFPEKAREFDGWRAWVTSIMDERLWIFDDLFHIEDIERQVREINRRVREKQLSAALAEGKTPEEAEKIAYGLDGVLGDHIHIAQTRRDFRGVRERELSYIGDRIKMLGKSLNVPQFWCAQLNRGPANDERRPRVSDIRDSGTLENAADCVLLLHRPLENKAGNKQGGDQATNEIELIVGKRRNGPANIASDLLLHQRIGRFEETKKSPDVRPGSPRPKGGYKREGQS